VIEGGNPEGAISRPNRKSLTKVVTNLQFTHPLGQQYPPVVRSRCCRQSLATRPQQSIRLE
jgi:hypothetical protein